MNTYLAQMRWCEREEPICVGTNKRKVASHALALLKAEHGTGLVNRGLAMCSARITADDIEVVAIPVVGGVDTRGSRTKQGHGGNKKG
jgi:hypothetical protein